MIPVQTKYGKMWMNIVPKFKEQHARMEFERGFLDYIENEDYDIFVDVGAAWGYFSIPASHHCSRVLAFEPQPRRRETLERNVKELNRSNITVSSEAVGTGALKLYINESFRGMVGPQGRGRLKQANINWVTLYEILQHEFLYESYEILIKVDVEGYERDVVRSLLERGSFSNVTFLIERHQFPNGVGYSEKELFEFMKPYKGTKLGARGHTSHYIFKLGED